MLHYITVSLRGWYPTEESLPASDFIGKLGLPEGTEAIGDGESWEAARIDLVELDAREFGDDEESSERFSARLEELLLAGARMLSQIDSHRVSSMKDDGLNLDVFVNLYLTQDQFDLRIPNSFLAEMARLGLFLEFISND